MTLRSELRPWTLDQKTETGGRRISVKRCCESCGAPIGDATPTEMDAAINGRLPDIAEECGCAAIAEQLAMLNQRADAHQNGTWPDGEMHPTWEELGPAGQESYRTEALRSMRALIHLGWGPLQRVLKQIEETP
ncbi:hypothetical protein ACTJJ4_07540 [Microbacterium sp. 22195]|uniref:hypothetical protein n=1 Tax=Microbacterium sp. 22195 TaxID=3453891 RepID=UPI003F826115